jgi:putative Holliday junction resolvase
VGAQRDLRASGVSTRKGRGVVDQAAAVIILQAALDSERQSGVAPGRVVDRRNGSDGPPSHSGADDDVEGEG